MMPDRREFFDACAAAVGYLLAPIKNAMPPGWFMWRGRWTKAPEPPQQLFYMSRVGDPTDWDYEPADWLEDQAS